MFGVVKLGIRPRLEKLIKDLLIEISNILIPGAKKWAGQPYKKCKVDNSTGPKQYAHEQENQDSSQ